MNIMQYVKRILSKNPLIKSIIVKALMPAYLRKIASSKGLKVTFHSEFIDFTNKKLETVRLSVRHMVYGKDITDSFDYYYSAVLPIQLGKHNLVDYSLPRYHDVVGFEKHPVYFPSLAEPVVTTHQYLEFANIKASDVVFDLGAYSGLTSIIFKDMTGASGTVIAVDADEQNIHAINKNFSLYNKISGNTLELLNAAVWNHNHGLDFSNEGNMGSSAAEIVGASRGKVRRVSSIKLSQISEKYALKRVDFIKCDIEGAESVIFEDESFFEKYKPRIIVETHFVDGIETTDKVMLDLGRYGYTFKRIEQKGVILPLLECYPPT